MLGNQSIYVFEEKAKDGYPQINLSKIIKAEFSEIREAKLGAKSTQLELAIQDSKDKLVFEFEDQFIVNHIVQKLQVI